MRKFSSKQFTFFYVRIVKGPKSNIFTCKLCAWVIFIILFTGLLCDNSNSLTYEPRKGQSPTLSRANCVILHLMLAFHSNKQLLDEVFVISTIIKVEVGVISRSRRLRLITLTETLIILDITKTESNKCFIIHWTNSFFLALT